MCLRASRTCFFFILLARAQAESPSIISVRASDPDEGDRYYSVGDVLSVFFISRPTFGQPVAQSLKTGTLSKSAVDALLTFSVNLGADYVGEWATFSGQLDELVVTVVDVTGADVAQLQALK